MEQIYITEVGLTRRAVKRFENRINELFQNGWVMNNIYNNCYMSIEKKGLKFICSALLTRIKKTENETANLKEPNER